MTAVTLTTPAGPRTYRLTVPAGEPLGAALFLPGTGGTAEWAADDTRFPQIAAAAGLAVAVPEGLPTDPNKPAKFLTNPTRWNDGGSADPSPPASKADDVAYLLQIVADLIARGFCPSGRVGVTGFSNGAGMAYRFAAERADSLAALAPVAGHCWSIARPSRPVPTMAIGGALDPLMPLAGGAARLPWGGVAVRPPVAATFRAWATANGCARDALVTTGADGVTHSHAGPVAMTRMVLTNQGHHWPGGAGRLGVRVGGPNDSAFDASGAITRFFLGELAGRRESRRSPD